MKTTIYAVVRNQSGQEIARHELGNVLIDNDGAISARRYDELKRAARKIQIYKNNTIKLETADGKKDTFGGYPAVGCKYSVKFN